MNIEKISFSKINTYLKCPLRYYFRYIENLIIPPQGFVILGKATHKGLEYNYKEKAKHKKEPHIKKVLEYYDWGWEEAKKENEEWGIEWEEPEWKIKDDGVKLVSGYYENVSPAVIPKSENDVEKEFLITFTDFPCITGFIDLITHQDEILDHKVAKRKPTTDEISFDIQGLIYQVAFYYEYKKLPAGFFYDLLLKYKEPKFEKLQGEDIRGRVKISRNKKQSKIKWLEKVLQRAVMGIKNNIFFPVVNPINCSWCGYKDRCREGKW